MKIEMVDAFNRSRFEYCSYFPNGYIKCKNFHSCNLCEIADRLRKSQLKSTSDVPLFYWRDALPQTPSLGGENWYKRPVILSIEALDRLKLDRHLINQIMIACGGPGCFKKNVVGEIDGYLLCNSQKVITVTRKECYGIPTLRAAEKYDKYFFLGLSQLLKKN